ncbi:MAG: response regulator [Undibacterium sp.]|nr:response regulator [Undibacterium sp.]
MAIPTSYKDKQILIIDDMPDMRSSLRGQIASLGIPKVSVAGNVRDALDLIRQKNHDVILCDYFLGAGTDGQQFLEYLRTTNAISRATLFIMITAETGYESVITAAECLPDDYLLKPFTAETLKTRLERLLDKKARLATIDKLQDKEAWLDIIKACDEIVAARDKYLVDALRIKGNALVMAKQFEAAIQFYQQALATRAMPWASLGLAKALNGKGDAGQAKTVLSGLISASPNLLSAYDLLGRIHTDEGQGEAALAILDSACAVAPNSMARQRSLAGIAEDMGDFTRVEKALSIVVKKTRNSPLRMSGDVAKLGNALTEMGELAKAVALIEEAKATFKDADDVRLLAAVEAVTLHKSGKPELAKKALELALQGSTAKLPEATNLAIAKACLANDRVEEAMAVLKTVVQNNPDSIAIHGRIVHLMKDHGGEEAAKLLIQKSAQEVIDLNNSAIVKAKAGEFAEAARMLSDAAEQLPNNLQIVSNAALSLLVDVFMNGMDADKLNNAKAFQQAVITQNSQHPKLAEIAAFMLKVQTKYKLENAS